MKGGEPFGLDPAELKGLNYDLAVKRILFDTRSDFVYAPHLNIIYRHARSELTAKLKKKLEAGQYSPTLPVTIDVPKSFRMLVRGKAGPLGPPFFRPGSILLPEDRLLYQLIADVAAPIIEEKTDKDRSFSHRLAPDGSPRMFLSTRTCWNALQKALRAKAIDASVKYVLKIDIANFFAALNQHTLINTLGESGLPKLFNDRLEALLSGFLGDRNSHGILQGMFPSDLFGNYYLEPLDRMLKENGVEAARYVDDVYIFVTSLARASGIIRQIIPFLRSYNLSLHETKSFITPKARLIADEPDLDALFQEAVDEVTENFDNQDLGSEYGFQSDWNDDEDGPDQSDNAIDEEDDINLKATKKLFDAIGNYPGQEESIERFCLPLFSAAGSNYAVDHVIEHFTTRPAMAQIFCAYLVKFIDSDEVRSFLASALADNSLLDWQRMWVIAALLSKKNDAITTVPIAWTIVEDASRHLALRSVAAILVGYFGDNMRRKQLNELYALSPPYLQAAIYYSTERWPAIEKSKAKSSWGNANPLNELVTAAFKAKSKLAKGS